MLSVDMPDSTLYTPLVFQTERIAFETTIEFDWKIFVFPDGVGIRTASTLFFPQACNYWLSPYI
jgi:hypothetical protein